MKRSTRNEAQPKTAQTDRDPQNLSERAIPEANPLGESGAALETLRIRHAALRIERWPRANVMESRSDHGESAALRLAAQRLRRPPRRRTPLHCLRPAPGAEARFALMIANFSRVEVPYAHAAIVRAIIYNIERSLTFYVGALKRLGWSAPTLMPLAGSLLIYRCTRSVRFSDLREYER